MKRRIIKLGTTTLVASLPSKWVRQFDLKAGDYIDVSERNKDLLLSTEKAIAVQEKIIDCRKLMTRLVEEYLVAAYILGYHTIEILHEPRIREYKTKKMIKSTEFLQGLLRHFVGVEIVEQSETRTVIKELAAVSPDELMVTLRRIFLLIKELGISLGSALETRDRESLLGMSARHENVRKFLIYFMRVLNKQGYSDFSKTNNMFVVADNLWFIATTYKVVSEDALAFKRPFSKKAVTAFKTLGDAFVRFSEMFFNFKPETAYQLMELRENLIDVFFAERSKMSAEDATLYSHIGAIVGHLMHLIRMKFALEL